MKSLLWRAAPHVWRVLSSPSAKRGSLNAEIGTLITAVIFGLVYYFLHHSES